jgi:hypothetical protein
MFPMPKQLWTRAVFVVGGAAVLGLTPLVYAEPQPEEEAQVATPRAKPGSNTRGAERRKMRVERQGLLTQFFVPCILEKPFQVHRYAVTCPTTRHIDVKIADCCHSGDHWEVTVKTWDPKPNAAVATAPGGEGDFSMPARVFTYSSSRDMSALVECRYLHGTSMFPADADIVIETNGSHCTVEDLGASF